MSRLSFQLQAAAPGSKARAGTLRTLHGEVLTPVFMPVGTQATVRSQTVDTLRKAGSRILLANTYHLMLRPGAEVFKRFGGIHRFMNWDGPVLTDSGGFQIFSLPGSRKMTEQGAEFESYVDHRSYLLSPEKSIETQKAIGSDIMMVLDQCIPSTSEYAEALAAMELTHRWAKRSLQARGDSPQALFGIVQGACFHELRKKSADFLTQLPFDGFAIGGLAVGEGRELRDEFTGFTAALLPEHLPRYLMGVGTPIDILEAVHRGVDMFDCILPTQFAQRGAAFTSHGKLQLRRTVYRLSEEPLDSKCRCQTCQEYSRAYLHHLIKTEEGLGWHLIANHNITFYHQLMREIREEILRGTFHDYYETKRLELIRADDDNPVTPPKKSRSSSKRRTLGDYEIHLSAQGFSSIRQISSGEIMHSVSAPSEEADRLYIQQSRMADRLLEKQGSPVELIIWDVGLGAASNAMAAIQCFETIQRAGQASRPLRIISFERDMAPLLLASKNAAVFPHLRHAAPYSLLEKGAWTHPSGLLRWELIQGDFLETHSSARRPHLVFYDPFSFKVDSTLWTPEAFSRLYQHISGGPAEVYTYSASTAVRAAMLFSGFYVAKGITTGPKAETTVAYTKEAEANHFSPLEREWLERWNRSGAKFPAGLSESGRAHFETRIREHPQFQEGH